jgi:hypothetical protein
MPAASTSETPIELRIHGVGGSPGPQLLGYEFPDQAPMIAQPAPGIVVRQRRDRTHGLVQGFDWGSLNSDSRLRTLWVFLLPFTLLNVAGWAIPRPVEGLHSKLTRVMQSVVILLGWVLTATSVLWIANLLVGYLGYQWAPRALGAADGRATFNPLGAWHIEVTLAEARVIGVWLGTLISLLLLIIISVIAGRAEESSGEPPRGGQAFGADASLTDSGFFGRRPSWAASRTVHLIVAVGSLAIVVVQASRALIAPSPPRVIGADSTVAITGGLQLFLLLVLGAVALIVRMMRSEAGPGVMWAFAVMAFALTNAFFSGVVVWTTKYLATHLVVTGQPAITPGSDLATVDAYVLVVVLWALIAGILVLHRTRIRGLPRTCEPEHELREEWRGPVRRAEGTALIIHKIDILLVTFGAIFVAAGVGIGGWRAGAFSGDPFWEWRLQAPDQDGLAYTAAAWLLPAFVVFVMIRVRKAASDNRLRRFIGQAWDVLSFWPRRFHPFAVRPYSHIAVPALSTHISQQLATGPVVVSAHSQGSILAFAALSQLTDLSRVGLVTYGSPVGTLHRRGFGAYFGEGDVMELRARLGGVDGKRWQNLFRETDPVGGRIFDGLADHCVPDPAITEADAASSAAPLEHDREPGVDIAIHSFYLNERQVKDCVRQMKELLGRPR